jgi:HemY protein
LRIVTSAELLLEQRRADEALAVLQALPRKHTAALRLELRAQQQSRRWPQVVSLVGELERRNALDAEQSAKLRAHALTEGLRRQAFDAYALDEAWKKVPEADKLDTSIATTAAQCYIALGRHAQAQQIIEQSLEQSWDSAPAALYADAAGDDVVRQIERAEAWLERQPHDAALLVTLGRLCARQGLWGKAQSYIEAGVSIEPTYNGYFELARLEERLGNAEAARRHYGVSLDLALKQLRQASAVPRA